MSTRRPCCEKVGLKKGPCSLPARAGLQRCGKSCGVRWINYLKPNMKRGNFSLEEDHTIIQLHDLLGDKWSTIATLLPKRTCNDIKNHWNTNIKKILIRRGIDPTTHKPKFNNNKKDKNVNVIKHMAQWKSVRLEAEARSSMLFKLEFETISTINPTKLIISKINQTQPLLCSSSSNLSISNKNKNNNNAMYNSCAIMLAIDHDDPLSPISKLNFHSRELHVPTKLREGSLSYESDHSNNNMMETTNGEEINMDGYVLQYDIDIMVALEAFRDHSFNGHTIKEFNGNGNLDTSISFWK